METYFCEMLTQGDAALEVGGGWSAVFGFCPLGGV